MVKVPPRKRTQGAPILPVPPPPRVRLPLGDLLAVVRPGDRVTAGSLLARSPEESPRQSRRHSPLSGVVVAVTDEVVVCGEPGPVREIGPTEGVVAAAREAGIVGMGGGMFPTYLKLERHPERAAVHTVIVNGSQSEPYTTCDHRVLLEHRADIDRGLALVTNALGAEHGLVVAEDRGYPGGDERLLVRRALDREVTRRDRPGAVGAVVMNVQTVRAVHRAVHERRPLVDRVLTVDGGAVGRPGNYVVPIGTEVGHLLEACAVDLGKAAAVVCGGPMMGFAATRETPVTAGTIAVLALTQEEVTERRDDPCIRCGQCLEACPFDLPAGLLIRRPSAAVLDCVECGMCEFVCPSQRHLVVRLRALKAEWREVKP